MRWHCPKSLAEENQIEAIRASDTRRHWKRAPEALLN
jgi:hypothetical protein